MLARYPILSLLKIKEDISLYGYMYMGLSSFLEHGGGGGGGFKAGRRRGGGEGTPVLTPQKEGCRTDINNAGE